jgi:hypothetical protein
LRIAAEFCQGQNSTIHVRSFGFAETSLLSVPQERITQPSPSFHVRLLYPPGACACITPGDVGFDAICFLI